MTTSDPRPGVSSPLVPPDGGAEHVRRLVREDNARAGRWSVVLDDDPTGSQCVRDVEVVLSPDAGDLACGITAGAGMSFVLTNTRSMAPADARSVTARLLDEVHEIGAGLHGELEIVSRSDSCLRGHIAVETTEMISAARAHGRPLDGIVFVPALPAAGRITAHGTHWARVDRQVVPVGETEYARDATFGYRSSTLPDHLAEVSGGSIPADQVWSLDLDDIREGGAANVADLLQSAHNARWIAADAVTEDDLDVIALGVRRAQAAGRRIGVRCGPAFVRALAGQDPPSSLTPTEIPRAPGSRAHGLVVAGSHTDTTTRQLHHLRRSCDDLVDVQLDVLRLRRPDERDDVVRSAVHAVTEGLADATVLLSTSRELVRAASGAESLELAGLVSGALVEIVAAARASRPSWVIGKGGITSHDVASHGLGIRRATVLGQARAAGVAVLLPTEAPEPTIGMPYVVFPGNVGEPAALDDVVRLLDRSVSGS